MLYKDTIMDIREKAGDFLLDLAKLVFGGVILAGIVAEDINRFWLYTVGGIAFVSCCVTAMIIFKTIKEEEK